MYFNDHNPPHFHAIYNEFDAEIAIAELRVIDGKLPPRVLGFVIEWAETHKQELQDNWGQLQTSGTFSKIAPLT
jgi:hypothetical protein